jgi:subtilisin-like proprotein convertase family protein
MSAPITMSHGGAKQIFELATDELYLRLPDGSQSVVSIPKASSPEDFAAAIEKARAEHGAEPELVLYIAGAPRNEFSRRIVTRDVVITAPSQAEADELASEAGMVFQKALHFAPGNFVYKAPTSLAALAMQLNAEAIHLASVSTQLASRAAKLAMPNDPYVQLQWHLKFEGQKNAVAGTDINVESVWNYPSTTTSDSTRGRGVVIGIVDDGLEWSHPDLRPNVLPDLQYDWNGKDNDPNPFPTHSHGTTCGGVAAARGNNRIGVSGVAPDSGLAGMRLIAGDFTDLDVAEAMTWKMDEIHVLSNSWGRYAFKTDTGYPLGVFSYWFPIYFEGFLSSSALKYAADFGRNGKGTIITFAAGNHDELTPSLGAARVKSGARVDFQALPNSIYTIAVGAVDSLGSKAFYSQIGSSLLISAPSLGAPPSLGIMTTDNKGVYGDNPGFWAGDFPSSGDVTKNFSGTSAACPVVSGVVALMLEKNPDLGWRDVQEILIRSAKKVDSADADWVDNSAGFHFNHKYGAGLVDAAAAVALSSGWANLASQKSQSTTTTDEPIGAGATITCNFTVNGTALRTEHATLELSIADIPKGDLMITLTSPDGTESIFCEPHSDTGNFFTNWKFMTVRNWGEGSNGTWTLSITNNGVATGSLTAAELVVYGTESGVATDPAPVVTLQASRTKVFVGSNLNLNATAIDQNADATAGTVKTLEAFVDGTSLGVSENGTWTVQAKEAGNFSFTVNATDSGNQTTTSQAVTVEVLPAPIAAWDFDTPAQNPVPLAVAVQSVRKYAANFGTGNMTFDGSFDGNVANSNKWEYAHGQIFNAVGTAVNAVSEMESGTSNKALLLRGGKNIGADGKSIVFEFSMAGKTSLNVSYAAGELNGGFDSHNWAWSTDGMNWTDINAVAPGIWFFDAISLPVINDLNDATTAYLRVEFTGATAVAGQNYLDNIILSASPITPPVVSESFTVVSRPAAKALISSASPDSFSADAPVESQAATYQTTADRNLEWIAPEGGAYSMFVYAEVAEGSEFVNAPGSLLSANEDGKVLGLAEPISQSTRYELGISSADPAPEPLRLKVYDSKSKGILVLEEKVPFAPGTTIGSPSIPKRYKVAYQEAEQVVLVSPGWNTFTTTVDPDPATLGGVFSNYDYSEGDELVGPSFKATVFDGKWSPLGLKLAPGATYSLLRQAQSASQIVLTGKALEETAPPQPVKPADAPTAPVVASSSNTAQTHTHSPAPAASSGGGSESAKTLSNSSKGGKKAKNLTSSKKKSAKKSKTKSS